MTREESDRGKGVCVFIPVFINTRSKLPNTTGDERE